MSLSDDKQTSFTDPMDIQPETMGDFHFQTLATEGSARAGLLQTAHGRSKLRPSWLSVRQEPSRQ